MRWPSGVPAPELDELDVVGWARSPGRPRRAAGDEQLAVEHASARSVWFRNSVRGAAGLAVAVYIAQRTGLQHAFWVVLGTLSVLRSNALGTGWSIVSALAGTAVGIVVGAALVIAIGTHEVVLWAVLPLAVLLAAYAPRAISFAAGQAGFTVVLFVLFNLIQPVGWRSGSCGSRTSRSALRSASASVCSSGRAARPHCCARTWPPPTRGAPTTSSRRLANSSTAQTQPLPPAPHRLQPSPRTGSTTPFASTSPSARRSLPTWRASRPSLQAPRACDARRSHFRRSAA